MSLLNPHSEELSKEIFTCTIKKKQKKNIPFINIILSVSLLAEGLTV